MYKQLRILSSLLLLIGLVACGQNDSEPPQNPSAEDTSSVAEATSQAAGAQVTRYDAETFYTTTSYRLAGGRAFSADGSNLLIGSDETGTFNVYALPTDGSEAVALTNASDTAHHPVSYFPKDDRVLYMADQKGNELFHLYVRETSGAVTDLVPGENLRVAFIRWSDDGKHFYITSTERDPRAFDVYRVSSEDYSSELIYENSDFMTVVDVSPNGRYLALTKNNNSRDTDLFLADLSADSIELQLLSDHEQDVKVAGYGFSPDGTRLGYATDVTGEFQTAWEYNIEKAEHRQVAQSNWDIWEMYYSPSGRYRVSRINHDGDSKARIEDLVDGTWVSVTTQPWTQISNIRFSGDESQLAMLASSSTTPNDIYVMQLDGASEPEALTTALSSAIKQDDLVESEVIRFRSFDDRQIPSIMYKPQQASAENPVPAVIWVHGGPGGQSRRTYTPMIQHLVNHGYAVLAVNNRGSSGYGKTFFHLDDKRHGEVDLDDIVYGKKYLQKLDWVDAERIGIMGGSYGGFMVGAALAFRPDEFKVGINIFGVMNWVRTLESIPPYWEFMRKSLYDELGDPAEDRERLTRISPLFHASNIKVPLMVVQGANDPRVLQVESDEIVAAVRANGVPVEYLLFPDEGHGFSQKANRIAASEAFLSFLNKYL